MDDKQNTFSYTYSAEQQDEIKSIREKYQVCEESTLETLRKLDRNAAKPGTIAAIAVGTAGTLIFGVGMCCVLEWTEYFIPGIIIGIIGMIGICIAYPLFGFITKKRRKKLAPAIMRLTDELMKEK